MNYRLFVGLLAAVTSLSAFSSAFAAQSCEERAVLVTEQTFKPLLFQNGNMSGTQIRFIDYAQCAKRVTKKGLITFYCEVHASCTTNDGDMVFGITLDSKCRRGMNRTILVGDGF